MRTRVDDRAVRRGTTRRTLLAAAALAAAGGCGLFDSKPDPEPTPDPLLPLLAGALALADRYDAVIGELPQLATRLTPLRDAHRVHAAELTRVIALPSGSPTPASTAATPSTPPPTEPGAAIAALRAAEVAGLAPANEACLAAPARRAALLGTIAACRATHVEVLT